MGQYWYPVNLDKKEFVHPHKLGSGLKLWEQLAAHPGTSAALVILLAAMPEVRGGGDFNLNKDLPPDYLEIAKRTIGRWVGDRVVLIGDYAADSDLPNSPIPASEIVNKCDIGSIIDISEDVCRVIEYELDGKFSSDGRRKFIRND